MLASFCRGHVSGEGEKDVYGETFTPLTNLRLSKPRYTMTSKYVSYTAVSIKYCANNNVLPRDQSLLLLGRGPEDILIDNENFS